MGIGGAKEAIIKESVTYAKAEPATINEIQELFWNRFAMCKIANKIEKKNLHN